MITTLVYLHFMNVNKTLFIYKSLGLVKMNNPQVRLG